MGWRAGPRLSMHQRLAHLALVVRDYDEAIAFYVNALGFELLEDTDLGTGKRWVRVRPRGSEAGVFPPPAPPRQEENPPAATQPGGRFFFSPHPDDFRPPPAPSPARPPMRD